MLLHRVADPSDQVMDFSPGHADHDIDANRIGSHLIGASTPDPGISVLP